MEIILGHLQNEGDLDGTEELLRILWIVYEALERTGDRHAQADLAEAHRQLEERANKISGTGLHGLFERSVPHNLAIKTAWQRQPGS